MHLARAIPLLATGAAILRAAGYEAALLHYGREGFGGYWLVPLLLP